MKSPIPADSPAKARAQLDVADGQCVRLEQRGTLPAPAHVFDERSINAVNAALAARRPLLVRGEPGTGKSQLARATAEHLGRPLISKVIDNRTEARDLLWEFDAVARLAEAQLMSALPPGAAGGGELRDQLAPRRFVKPGPLWWAINWKGAVAQLAELCVPAQAPRAPARWAMGQGSVLLIDEIDKGESDVPNGLLEALGEGLFRPPGFDEAVEFDGGQPPLVIITTNEERALPNAFLRRCLVLRLALPRLRVDSGEAERKAFVEFLIARGAAHFSEDSARGQGVGAAEAREPVSKEVLEEAATMLMNDRLSALERELPPPGLAEYLDLLRAVREQERAPKRQLALLKQLSEFVYEKHLVDRR
ncbi:MAG TPA: MoxR family ATPase [Polyangiaceae bacterium]